MSKPGDRVKMNGKYCVADERKSVEYIVLTQIQSVCGGEVVWLDGYDGCYAADGLTLVVD